MTVLLEIFLPADKLLAAQLDKKIEGEVLPLTSVPLSASQGLVFSECITSYKLVALAGF